MTQSPLQTQCKLNFVMAVKTSFKKITTQWNLRNFIGWKCIKRYQATILATFSQHQQTCTMVCIWAAFRSKQHNFSEPFKAISNACHRTQYLLLFDSSRLNSNFYRTWVRSIYCSMKAYRSTAILDKLWRIALRGVRLLITGSILCCRVILTNSSKLFVIHYTLKCLTRDEMCIYGQNIFIHFK